MPYNNFFEYLRMAMGCWQGLSMKLWTASREDIFLTFWLGSSVVRVKSIQFVNVNRRDWSNWFGNCFIEDKNVDFGCQCRTTSRIRLSRFWSGIWSACRITANHSDIWIRKIRVLDLYFFKFLKTCSTSFLHTMISRDFF